MAAQPRTLDLFIPYTKLIPLYFDDGERLFREGLERGACKAPAGQCCHRRPKAVEDALKLVSILKENVN